jgi:hypothetical protein
MNANDEHDDGTGALLREAAETFRPTDEMRRTARQRIMEAIESAEKEAKPQAAPQARPRRRRRWPWPAAGAAAALAAAALIALALWPSPLTLAQVQEAVNVVDWIHVKYDNGEERWISPTLQLSGYIHPASTGFEYMTFIDRRTGQRWSWINGGSYISEDDVSPWDSPRDAWEAIVGYHEERAKEPYAGGVSEFRRETEIVEGRRLVRFDVYYHDALGQSLLASQTWADPETRLPVSVRRRLSVGERTDDRLFITGTYEFPASGPESIHELGAPEGLPIIRSGEAEITDEIADLLDEITAAKMQFLEDYRVVHWSTKRPSSSIDVLYFHGPPALEERPWGLRLDYRQVSVRQSHYSSMGPEHPDYHLPMPATVEAILEWTATQTPRHIYLSDGERNFSRRGPLPPMFGNADERVLRVSRMDGWPPFPNGPWPTDFQWPLAHRTISGEIEPLTASENAPPGTIGIRTEKADIRQEYHVDPERDFICIRYTRWERRENGWFKRREETLSDLVQLPTGHWVATTKHLYQGGDPDRGFSPSENAWRIDIKPLAPDEFPPGIFDGEKLLEDAREKGYRIETF